MFDIGLPELLVLAVLALFIFGPEKLPSVAKKAAQQVRQLRMMATNARRDLVDELGPEWEDFDPRDLANPKEFVKRKILDGSGLDEDELKRDLDISDDLDLRDDLDDLDREPGSVNGSGSASGSVNGSDASSVNGTTVVKQTGRDHPPFDPEAT